MTIIEEEYFLRYIRGGVTSEAGGYGSANVGFGELGWTYGEKEGESVLAGLRYKLVPTPGWMPKDPGWTFRRGDTGLPFSCLVINQDAPSERLSAESVVSAELIMRQVVYGRKVFEARYDVIPDPVEDIFTRTWLEGDLQVIGKFVAQLRMTFETGRVFTVDTNDDSYIAVKDAPVPTDPYIGVTTPDDELLLTPNDHVLTLPGGQTP